MNAHVSTKTWKKNSEGTLQFYHLSVVFLTKKLLLTLYARHSQYGVLYYANNYLQHNFLRCLEHNS